MIQQVGRFVRINEQMIPAVNIQIENVPGYIDIDVGKTFWYGIYFEVPFENGALWVVSYGDDEDDYIEGKSVVTVLEFANFGLNPKEDYTNTFTAKDWDEFLSMFREKVRTISV